MQWSISRPTHLSVTMSPIPMRNSVSPLWGFWMVDVKLNREVRASFIDVSNVILLEDRGQEELLKASGFFVSGTSWSGRGTFLRIVFNAGMARAMANVIIRTDGIWKTVSAIRKTPSALSMRRRPDCWLRINQFGGWSQAVVMAIGKERGLSAA